MAMSEYIRVDNGQVDVMNMISSVGNLRKRIEIPRIRWFTLNHTSTLAYNASICEIHPKTPRQCEVA